MDKAIHVTSAALNNRLYELVRPVMAPFLLSRGVILVVGILLDWQLNSGLARKFSYIGDAPLASLSATFDANWYASVATEGYQTSADLTQQTNVHFMPLYPLLMRLAGNLMGLGGMEGGYNLAGVLLSHAFFMVALVLLYRFTLEVWGDERLGTWAVWVTCVLPWSFVFSMAYTESLFLMLSIGSLLIAYRARLNPTASAALYSGLLAALATLTRHQGIFIAMCAIWLLAITPRSAGLLARARYAVLAGTPAALAFWGFVFYIGVQTGELFAVLGAHDAWGKGYWHDLPRLFVMPPANAMWFVDALETVGLVSWVLITGAAIAMMVAARKGRDAVLSKAHLLWPGAWAFVAYTLAPLLFLLTSHTANSSWGRYMVVMFPCVWVCAWWGAKGGNLRLVIQLGLTLQIFLLAGAVLAQVTP